MKGQRHNKKKIILGITGSFGSGKTTVAKIFKSYGAKIIDADRIAHGIIRPKSAIYEEIVNAFGKDILNKDRTINRNKLAKIVFSNKNLLKVLNKIIHPEVIRVIKGKMQASKSKIIVLDVPLLIEAGLGDLVDKLIVVKIKRIKQIERLINKTTLTKADILKRIKSQISQNVKSRFANFVIDNSGTIEKTKKQAETIRRSLWKN